MRVAKVISISLPPDMNDDIQEIAKQERRSGSEIFREAIRQYAALRDLEAVRREARKIVKKRKFKPEDIEAMVAETRKPRRKWFLSASIQTSGWVA